MNHGSAEALFAALRRALPLILICTIGTTVAVNVQRQLRGPVYSATAAVYLSTRDLASILTNTQAPYVDPERANENALALARSTALFARVALENPTLGKADDIRSSVSVVGDSNSDVIKFRATADLAPLGVATANAVATQYVAFRSTVSGISTDQAIAKLRARLAGEGANKTAIRELLQRLELQQTLNSGDAIVIDPAQRAVKIAPAPVRDTMLSVAIGIILALMISLVRELLSTRVRSEDEVEDIIGRPIIATIPRLPKATPIVALGRHEAKYGDTYALLAANIEQEELEGRTSGTQATVIAITSAGAGEGKTTTAANLGIAMAKRGLRVALVDFDLRKPALGSVFRLPAQAEGVLQIVQLNRTVDSMLWSYPISGHSSLPQRLSASGSVRVDAQVRIPLVLVPSGGADRSGDAARSPNAKLMIDRLREEADVVIIDTPPALLATEMAELAVAVDGVIFVVRYGGPTRRELTRLARQAATWKADVVGIVLTAAPTSFERPQYYYRD